MLMSDCRDGLHHRFGAAASDASGSFGAAQEVLEDLGDPSTMPERAVLGCDRQSNPSFFKGIESDEVVLGSSPVAEGNLFGKVSLLAVGALSECRRC